MPGNVAAALHATRVIEQAYVQELRDSVDKARTADTERRNIASDHLQLDRVPQGHALDGALGGAHTAADLAALESRACRRGRRQRSLRAAAGDLAGRAAV